MYANTKAIVLSNIKFKDADLIVKCFTESQGIISFIIKGVLKSKKGKFRPAMFQLFNLLDIEFLHRNKGQLEYFKEVKIYKHLNSINTDVYKSSMVMFLSEVLKSVIYEEETNKELYNFLEESILILETSTNFSNFHISFLIKLSAFLGFSPQKPLKSDELYFNLNEGYFEETASKYSLGIENSNFLNMFLSHTLEKNHEIKLSKTQRKDMLNQVILYYELHIESFKKPKSLEVIQSVFG